LPWTARPVSIDLGLESAHVRFMKHLIPLLLSSAALIACEPAADTTSDKSDNDAPAFASTYTPQPSTDVLLKNAKLIDGVSSEIQEGDLLISGGKIGFVGSGEIPDGVTELELDGRFVTPWPQDPGFDEALQGGVTTLHILPGSANLFGGRGVTLRNVPSRTVQGMKFPDAPYTLKMACGENPKRVYGSKGGPGSRMGNVAGYRKNWIKAASYKAKRDKGGDYDRDLQLETLADVLDGKILVQMHCYRADEMVQILDIAKEFDYKVTTFHHAVEAYKIGDYLAENDSCAAMWADWGAFKMESFDYINENIPFVHAAGACAMIHSDDPNNIQRLNQEVAKTWADGNRAGLDISKAEAWKWLSTNPAKALGILEETGTLEAGKRADIVIWDGDPFSTYARPATVMVDGAVLFDRATGVKPKSDFRLGYADLAEGAK